MKKPELIDAVAKETGLTKKDTSATIKALTEVIARELKKENVVHITGFGSFELVKRAPRMGRNPQTGERMKLDQKKTPKFRAGKWLREMVR